MLDNGKKANGWRADIKQVERLMDGDKADMVFTDPPYGVAIGDKNKLLDTIQKARWRLILGIVMLPFQDTVITPETMK